MAEITVEKTGEDIASKSLKVTIPLERVQEAEEKALRHYAQRARLPGFRPGKAPDGVVRKRFNEAIRQAALEELIREGWETAKSAESLQPITDPSIRNLRFEQGLPLEFDLLVEVRPKVTLERIGGFTVTRTVRPVEDADVDDTLNRMREQKATWLPIEGERPVPGQLVRVEVAPIENGQAGAAQSYDLVLGEHHAVPALEEKIMELLPGETADAEIRFPDDHPDPARRGQTRQVRVILHEVKRQELPPLDDAFAREVGEFEDLAALRDTVRKDLEADAAREADAQVRQTLVEQIVEANQVPAPPSLVQRLLQAYAQAYQIPSEQSETFTAQFGPVAETQVRRDLVLDALVEAHQLKATEEELDERVAQLAEARKVPAGELYASLQKANRLGELERSLTEEKVFRFLLDQSTVEEATS